MTEIKERFVARLALQRQLSVLEKVKSKSEKPNYKLLSLYLYGSNVEQ